MHDNHTFTRLDGNPLTVRNRREENMSELAQIPLKIIKHTPAHLRNVNTVYRRWLTEN